MSRIQSSLALAALTLTATGLVASSQTALSASPERSPGVSPGLAPVALGLSGVTAAAADNAWAVGASPAGAGSTTLVEHFDGSTWATQTSYSKTGSDQLNGLNDVDADASGDAWAVGQWSPAGYSSYHVLAEWPKSTSHGIDWVHVKVPVKEVSQGGTDAALYGVKVLNDHDAWAVGGYAGGETGLIEHWNGHHWTQFGSPALGTLAAVDGDRPNDVWAVGTYENSVISIYWNGEYWRKITITPEPRPNARPFPVFYAGFTDVAFTRPGDAWVAAWWREGSRARQWAWHLSDGQWSLPRMPHLHKAYCVLTSTSGARPDDVWFVGYQNHGGPNVPLVENWDGSKVSVVKLRGQVENPFLRSVEAVTGRDAWAVGSAGAAGDQPLIYHWNGHHWTPF